MRSFVGENEPSMRSAHREVFLTICSTHSHSDVVGAKRLRIAVGIAMPIPTRNREFSWLCVDDQGGISHV